MPSQLIRKWDQSSKDCVTISATGPRNLMSPQRYIISHAVLIAGSMSFALAVLMLPYSRIRRTAHLEHGIQ